MHDDSMGGDAAACGIELHLPAFRGRVDSATPDAKETLGLRPTGHSDRADSFNNSGDGGIRRERTIRRSDFPAGHLYRSSYVLDVSADVLQRRLAVSLRAK